MRKLLIELKSRRAAAVRRGFFEEGELYAALAMDLQSGARREDEMAEQIAAVDARLPMADRERITDPLAGFLDAEDELAAAGIRSAPGDTREEWAGVSR